MSLVGFLMNARLVIHISASAPVTSFPLIRLVIILSEALVPTIGMASKKNFLKMDINCNAIII
jgi:hypothetical protein